MSEPTREQVAAAAYEAEEQARAKEEGEPAIWTPWRKQTSRREQRVAYAVADAILTLFTPHLRTDEEHAMCAEARGYVEVERERDQLRDEVARSRAKLDTADKWIINAEEGYREENKRNAVLEEALRSTMTDAGHFSMCLAGQDGRPISDRCSEYCRRFRAALTPPDPATPPAETKPC